MNTTPNHQHYRVRFECTACGHEFAVVTPPITPKPNSVWGRCGECAAIGWSSKASAIQDGGRR